MAGLKDSLRHTLGMLSWDLYPVPDPDHLRSHLGPHH